MRLLVLISILFIAFNLDVKAQSFCMPYSEWVSGFRESSNEVPVTIGLRSDGNLLVTFASPSGSWSLLVVYPNGLACALFGGSAWYYRALEEEKA